MLKQKASFVFDLQRFADTTFNIATGNTVLSSSAVPVSVNQVTGTLPVNKGGTGATVLSAVTVGSATSANSATTAGSLTTARALQVSLNKTSSTNFQGNANVTDIGVQGILAIGNGGTGMTSNPSMLTNLGTTAAANVFAASPRPGITGTLGVGNGGTGQTNLANVAGIGSALRVNRGTLAGTTADNLMYVQMADNDYFRIRVGGTASNAGWVEFATADDSNEPIYVRQYSGAFTTLTRTATLLDASGNTSFPGTVTAAAFSGTFTGNVSSAVTASSLATARALQVSLSNTAAANFQGNGDVKTIGVQGILAVANGGTGTNNLANVAVGAATKATQDGSGNTITTTYAPLALPATQNGAHNIPYAGNSGKTSATIHSFQSLKSGFYTETLSSNVPETSSSNSWYNVVSVRHRNGGTDGTQFGMLVFSRMNQEGNLYWQQQVSGSWKNSKMIIDSSNIGSQTVASAGTCTGNANTASSLATARALQVSLSNTSAVNFQGNGDVKTIGVQGVLAVANGGTGTNNLANITVGKANTLTTARALQVSLSTSNAPTFNGTADVKNIGVTGTLGIANGGTGQTTAAAVRNTLGLGNTTGALPVANGGTGLTANPSMLVNLGTTAAANVLQASPRPGVSGTLPVANGGTGQTSIANIQAGKDGNGSVISSTYLKLAGGTLTGDVILGTNAAPTHFIIPSVGGGIGTEFTSDRYSGLTVIGKMDFGHDILVQGSNKIILSAGEGARMMYLAGYLPEQGVNQTITTAHNFEEAYIMADAGIYLCPGCDPSGSSTRRFAGYISPITGFLTGLTGFGGYIITPRVKCDTAAATAAKVVDAPNFFTLVENIRLLIMFNNGNSASNPTLNVSGTGAKELRYGGHQIGTTGSESLAATKIKAKVFYEIIYTGSYWYFIGNMDV